MNAVLRHTLRSVGGNKLQVMLVILTIVVVTVVVFAALSMSDVFYNVNMLENDRVAQGADMLLGANGTAGDYFSRTRVESVLSENPQDIKRAEYFYKSVSALKYGETVKTVLLEATDLNEYAANHSLSYSDKYVETKGRLPIIISKSFADECGLVAGDEVQIYLASADTYVTTVVSYIALNEGIFNSVSVDNVLVDFSAVGNYNLVSAVYITFTDPALFDKYESAFASVLPAISCGEGNQRSDVDATVKNNTLLFSIGIALIIATMTLILLTSYMIIARNRAREMSIFKAVGATPAQTALIMLTEVSLYAVIGGAVGLVAARLTMQIVVARLLPTASSLITYDVWKYAVSFIISFAVTVLATLVPVIKTSKQTVRQLMADSSKTAKRRSPWLAAALTLVLIGLCVGISFAYGILVVLLSVAAIAVSALLISTVVPFILRGMGAAIRKLKPSGGFGLGTVTGNRNKAVHTISTMLAVIIAFSFTIVEIVSLVKIVVTPFASRYDADLAVVVGENGTYEELNDLKSQLYVEGVSNVGFFNSIDFLLPEGSKYDLSGGEEEFTLYGVDSLWTLKHCCTSISEDYAQKWESVANPLVLNEDMMLRFNYKIGDTVTYSPLSADYRAQTYEFTIVGVDYSSTRYDRVGYVPYEAIGALPSGVDYFVEYADDANEDETLLRVVEVADKTTLSRCFVMSFEEWGDEGAGVEGIIDILTFLQIAIILVAVIGILNISIVTAYDRRSEMRLYRLCGMSDRDYLSFAASEGLTVALAGGLTGFAVAIVYNRLLPVFTAIVNKYISFGVVSNLSLIITAVAMVVFFAIWLAVAYACRKDKNVAINERFTN